MAGSQPQGGFLCVCYYGCIEEKENKNIIYLEPEEWVGQAIQMWHLGNSNPKSSFLLVSTTE